MKRFTIPRVAHCHGGCIRRGPDKKSGPRFYLLLTIYGIICYNDIKKKERRNNLKKLYSVVLLMVLVLVFSVPAQSQVTGCLESENSIQNGHLTPAFQFWIQGNFSKKFGYFGWALVNKNWSEIYPGLSWQPTSWLQVGIGAGIEQNQSKARVGEFIWIGKGKFYFLGFTEHQGSGFWYRAMAMYNPGKGLQVGLMSQYKLGIGPKVEVVVHKPFSLWVAILAFGQDPKATAFAGLKLGF